MHLQGLNGVRSVYRHAWTTNSAFGSESGPVRALRLITPAVEVRVAKERIVNHDGRGKMYCWPREKIRKAREAAKRGARKKRAGGTTWKVGSIGERRRELKRGQVGQISILSGQDRVTLGHSRGN